MSNYINLTKKTVENLPISPARTLYHDTHIKGLVIVVHPSGRKVWQVYKKMSGKPAPVRVTLGTYPDLTPFLARQQATEKIADISKGINPNQAKQAKRNKGVILEQVYKDYLEARTLKPGTAYDYKRLMDEQLSDWKKKPIKSITPDDVAIKHKKESKTSPARANNMGRLLRALFNFAIANYLNEIGEKIYTINPVSKLSETRAWNPNKRRKTLIKAVDLPDWYQAAQDLNTKLFLHSATVSRLYLLTLLFTGLRSEETIAVVKRESEIADRMLTKKRKIKNKGPLGSAIYDERDKTIHIMDTKNNEERVIPLSTHASDLMDVALAYNSDWLFPRDDMEFHIDESTARRSLDKIAEWSKVKACRNDLKRTFLTVAEDLEISPVTYKRLVGHTISNSQDVTAGYIVSQEDRLRRAAQQIGDTIYAAAIKPPN